MRLWMDEEGEYDERVGSVLEEELKSGSVRCAEEIG